MTKISIITTTYKHQDFIEETIKSILNQTFTDFELLIGDDSPDDKTWNIIQKYVKKYPNKIKAWHHKPNKGIVDNMNFLLSKVSPDSKYIAFLEGDDLYTPDNLEEKIEIFRKYPEVKLVYNNLDFINGKGKKIISNYFEKYNRIPIKNNYLPIEKYLLGYHYLSYSSLMISKDVLPKILSLNNKYFLTSDYLLFSEIANKYKIFGIKKSLTLYRIHNNNLSQKKQDMLKDIIIAREYLINKYKINNKKVLFEFYEMKTYYNYLNFNRINTIKNGILSFKYNFADKLIQRLSMIILVLLPKFINNFIYDKFKNNEK